MFGRVIAVHKLHALDRIGIFVVPPKPNIEIDAITVGTKIQLMNVVDVSADDHLIGRRGRRFGRFESGIGCWRRAGGSILGTNGGGPGQAPG